MSDSISNPGAHHERRTKLSSEQREAIVGRWPVRFTTGQTLVDRALWVSYRETVVQPVVPDQSQERAIGSNVIQLDARRQQPGSELQPVAPPEAVQPEEDSTLLAFRRRVNSAYEEKAA